MVKETLPTDSVMDIVTQVTGLSSSILAATGQYVSASLAVHRRCTDQEEKVIDLALQVAVANGVPVDDLMLALGLLRLPIDDTARSNVHRVAYRGA